MDNQKTGIKSFPKNFWTVIVMEFLERGSYYGVMSVLSVFLILGYESGGLGFSKEQAGAILGTIPPLLYFLPIISGAIAERYGYRKVLTFAFICMILGYSLTGMSSRYILVFFSLVIMALGAGFFKPVISGTIARNTNESNSTLGFGIFYWSINLGAFLFPLILVPILKSYSYSYIFYMAAIIGFILLLINIFIYKEPIREKSTKSLSKVFKDMVMVIKDWRFILMIFLYSAFWILYFQMFGTVLWYVRDYVDMTALNSAINSFLGVFIDNPSWKFDVEHVTVINAGVIIALQLFVSNIVKRSPALPTMIFGIGLGTIGMAILAFSSSPWIFITGIMVFTLGEMTTHPKFISYIGLIAPADKKAIYLGYSFLYGVIGSSIGGFLGSSLYVKYVDNLNQPRTLWLILAGIGVVSMVSLTLYNKFIAKNVGK
ncbi:MAG: peptide permease [Bacteroidetes bacterium GWF2_41_61]|jgi:dipeptide/tripeptide permease|nr:MAG: peptide permease [Bacteroidetes bacterium GWE2_40_15]OFY29462.1 MAG: peptide permease [Bacteroidetes bacterium GWF2_41_61]OFY88779.1 MAG: peptide permease [Bacteroidetes bacterium RIFOXYA12_FULL_40_10]PKP06254.1 MAG: MFS transporter [Bacteroidetes bacterium HGW-Bacteroidetes-5]HBG23796.1 MFS transporter [Rikenellaceae bacterium]